jgi:hypothetical protein
MADLLECLLQIKGLRDTADRLSALAARIEPDRWSRAGEPGLPNAAELLARLADLESVHGTWLRLMVGSERPLLPSIEQQTIVALARFRDWSAADALDRFLRRRLDNLELLDACSAEDLDRVGAHAARRNLTVADVVATMLATDFDLIAQMRHALGEP